VSSATFYKWKAKFGGLEVSEAKRLRALEDENGGAEADAGGQDARQRRAEGSSGKKVVTPAARREAARYLRQAYEMSERRPCRDTALRWGSAPRPLAIHQTEGSNQPSN